ncbi:RNA polymerase sigma factor [Haliea sp. E17]|uniref:RNA polymerase sigma factor n=1 Tax=Haliea sp. E17 TaxID=3401576 RepID=UPI003AAB1008
MENDKNRFIAELVHDHRAALESFLAQRLGNPDEAAELVQEVFIRLHRLETPEQLENPRAYLYQAASNLAVDQLRRRKLHFRFLAREQRAPEEIELASTSASPEQILAARQRLAAVNEAINTLPFKARQAFLMHRQSGMSYSAIAEELRVSVSSVEKYILQALRECRTALENTEGVQ